MESPLMDAQQCSQGFIGQFPRDIARRRGHKYSPRSETAPHMLKLPKKVAVEVERADDRVVSLCWTVQEKIPSENASAAPSQLLHALGIRLADNQLVIETHPFRGEVSQHCYEPICQLPVTPVRHENARTISP